MLRRVGVAIALAAALTAPTAASAAPVSAADLDCSDFGSQAAAQDYFVALGGPAVDPDRLDADGDGIACEDLPCPCSSGSPPPPPPPACSTPAIAFVGLGNRLVIGRQDRFYVADRSIDGYISGRVRVEMLDEAGRAFAALDLLPDSEEAWLRLDLGDRWATVVASATETRFDGSSCSWTITKRVDAVTRIYLPSRCFDPREAPASVVVACGDGNFQLKRLRWRAWGRQVARASGRAWVNDCVPYCAAGTFHRRAVSVRVSARKLCPGIGKYVYTRLAYRMHGALPRGVSRRRGVATFPCRLYDR